jgi:hypothetical protein
VHADSVGPLIASHDKARFILIAHDDWSGWCCAVPLRKKEAKGMAVAFDATFGFRNCRTIRVDPGLEFTGEVKHRAEEHYVVVASTVPRRPQTNARAE